MHIHSCFAMSDYTSRIRWYRGFCHTNNYCCDHINRLSAVPILCDHCGKYIAVLNYQCEYEQGSLVTISTISHLCSTFLLPMFDKSCNFHIHQSILIDTPGAIFNYGHGCHETLQTWTIFIFFFFYFLTLQEFCFSFLFFSFLQ